MAAAFCPLELYNVDSGAIPCFAMGKERYRNLRNQGIIEESPRTDTDIELESWAYNPRILCGPDSLWSTLTFSQSSR